MSRTYEEAVAEVLSSTRGFSALDIADLFIAAKADETRPPTPEREGEITLLVRSYHEASRGPDETFAQVFGAAFEEVEGYAKYVLPIVSVVITLAPIL